ncbi:ABC transporter ATP-binding protein [candidate division KSB1 bacterium]|nr:ABC transporter ATP-binding protein [candidate division KSB1 bacterium]
MAKTVIQFNNLGKSYMIGHKGQEQRYLALRDVIGESLQKWWSRIRHPEYYTHENLEEFWALRDIDLEVKEGDRLGIIGRNGAGKTTLLKVLSRITEPTAGRIKVKGRVASLLEVGTGFHPELTGRENIYLNGAILGMKRSEIKRKFDEIVDFAGVEQFLDTPVKRFSSGMHVRLGFSVAAHLEPEILVVDEVLAVGDASFQKKCIGKMDSVAKEGRTILFVSHQMQAITSLCNGAILLDSGKIVEQGGTKEVVDKYLNEKSTGKIISLIERKDRQGNGSLKVIDTWIENDRKHKVTQVQTGSMITICAKFQVINRSYIDGLITAFALNTIQNIQISDLSNVTTGNELNLPDSDTGIIRCIIKKLPVNVGIYTYNIMVRNKNRDIIDYLTEAGRFDVIEGDYFGTGKITLSDRLMMMEHHWEIEPSGKISEC